MRIKSHMSHQFSQVPDVKLERSAFNRSHGYKTTFDSGYLIPVFVDEALPGDTFNVHMTAFARMATPLKPVMDNLFLDTFFFAVPNRLIWANWQKFNGEQDNPGDSVSFVVPYMDSPAVTGYAEQSLFDYMGIPTKVAGLRHNTLPLRAYNLIYNTWFKDENLIPTRAVQRTTDSGDLASDFVLQRRGKRHDYFTSCLPWPQKGAAVSIPLGTSAPVLGIGKLNDVFSHGSQSVYENYEHSRTYANSVGINASLGGDAGVFYVEEDPAHAGYHHITADLTNATAATINSLRQAFQLQRMLERDARGGTRYIEIIRSHFGVVSPDARMQRPEYLGGGSSPININPVAQTSVAGSTPQGNLAGIGTARHSVGFSKSFTEHCTIIGLVSVRADLTYQQGLDRMWSRSTRYDFYWPSLSHLGEQAVLNKEIYAQPDATKSVNGVDSDNALAFGYQERYAEYRYKPSKITGKFRSNTTGPLDVWHLSQQFGSLPTLGQTFIEENPPLTRVMAVNTEPQFLFDSYFDMKCVRPMPVYSVPGLIDHL